MIYNSFERIAPKKEGGWEKLGVYRVNPRQVVAFGAYSQPGSNPDEQGNLVTEILLSTGHVLFVSETPSEVDRRLSGAY